MAETATTPASEASPRKATLRIRLGAFVSVAKHPLVLLAAGALVSELLVPALTRGAQNHQKGLEIKSDLVRSMSAAASPFLAASLANVLVYNGKAPHSYTSSGATSSTGRRSRATTCSAGALYAQ